MYFLIVSCSNRQYDAANILIDEAIVLSIRSLLINTTIFININLQNMSAQSVRFSWFPRFSELRVRRLFNEIVCGTKELLHYHPPQQHSLCVLSYRALISHQKELLSIKCRTAGELLNGVF